MIKGLSQVAIRIDNGINNFIENIMTISGCTKVEAEKVYAVYKKKRIVKLDPVGGVIKVRHGIFMEKDIIQNAINA